VYVDPAGSVVNAGFDPQSPPDERWNIDMRWWMGGYALVLSDVTPLPFVATRGYQGLWDVRIDEAAYGKITELMSVPRARRAER
jgi:hypothetical protein